MKAEDIYRLLAMKPFRPVRVALQDGTVYDIPTRALAIVGVNYLDIGFQAPGYPEGIWERGVTVPIDQISSIQPVDKEIRIA